MEFVCERKGWAVIVLLLWALLIGHPVPTVNQLVTGPPTNPLAGKLWEGVPGDLQSVFAPPRETSHGEKSPSLWWR